MDRIELVKEYVDAALEQAPHPMLRQHGYCHLYAVSQNCALLALKRGEDPELSAIAGLLHDISTCTTGDAKKHAEKGALMAKGILKTLTVFTEGEIEEIASAIAHHSDKGRIHAPLDEILKDADVLHHCLYSPLEAPASHEAARFALLKKELGLE